MNGNILTIVLSSGVIASIIASIINLFSIRTTNNRFYKLEALKNNNEINTYRYTKLFELNNDLNNLPDIDYTFLENVDGELVQSKTKFAKVVGESTDRFSKLIKIYNRARPLFDETFLRKINDLIRLEKNESNSIVDKTYNGKNAEISKLLDLRSQIEMAFSESIIIQLRNLINK